MNTLFKMALFTSPILGLVFYYVVVQQGKIDTQMQREDAEFSREWNEFNKSFAKGKEEKETYAERAAKADAKLKEMEEKEKAKERKAEKFEKDFEIAIDEFEAEKKKEGSNE